MLAKREVEALLVLRIKAASESCNSHHINHVDGQIRALTAVLKGKPVHAKADVSEICKYVDIPCVTNEDDTIGFNDDWLRGHGFVIENDDFHHPTFGQW